MRWLLLFAFVVLIPAHGMADALQIAPERVSAVVTADWNEDGTHDRVLLVETDESVDLLIYMSSGKKEDYSHTLKLHTRVTNLAWRGAFSSQQPTLTLSSKKSLELTVMSLGFGRYPWESKLTIAFRDGVFRVAGYTHLIRDRLEKKAGSCDVNLLTGRGVRDGKAFRVVQRAVPVAEWANTEIPTEWEKTKIPAECRNFFP